MRMRLLEGRFFTDAENRPGGRPVAVISASMGAFIWPGEPMIGKCFHVAGERSDAPCTEVIGAVADVRLFPSIRPTNRWAATYYRPIEQAGGRSATLLVRTTGDPTSLFERFRREAQSAGADLPFVDVRAFDDVFLNMLRPWRLGSTVFVAFGAVSLIVAAVGLAVVAAYNVTRRTREMGIRATLGAQPRDLVRPLVWRSVSVVVVGLATGLAVAWWGGRVLSAQLFEVTAGDPRVLGGTTLVLLVVGVIAAWLPARRAARIDPVVALRSE
jgi:hypothetical protein